MARKVVHPTFGESTERLTSNFAVDPQELVDIVDDYRGRLLSEDINSIERLGGVHGLMEKLKVNPATGLITADNHTERLSHFGSNRRLPPKRKTYCELCHDATQDSTLRILMVAGVVSLIIGATLDVHPEYGWIEGFAILIAIVVVVFVTATNDYQKQKKFAELQEKNRSQKAVTILRDGEIKQLHPQELMVGDILVLTDGITIPADGVLLIGSEIEVVEAAMTGENDNIHKISYTDSVEQRDQFVNECPQIVEEITVNKSTQHVHDIPSPVCLSGTSLAAGTGQMVVIAIGTKSAEGRIIDLSEQDETETPLQKKLTKIADDVGKLGLACAVIALVVLYLRFGIEVGTGQKSWDSGKHPMELVHYFITAVTILVVAIPEGLPLAVTISLAYSVKKMQEDKNLVRRMHACETMGGADMICSDKTGTLTQNNMSVTELFHDGTLLNFETTPATTRAFTPEFLSIFKESSFVNSSAYFGVDDEGKPKKVGSNTEIAFLNLLGELGHSDYANVRSMFNSRPNKEFPFNSKRKCSSKVIAIDSEGHQRRVHVKGAAEVLLQRCTHFLRKDGTESPMNPDAMAEISNTIKQMAVKALRAIVMCYRNLPQEFDILSLDAERWPAVERENLTFITVVGIKDPLRESVPESVSQCKQAGITVRMVTGDFIETARAIAKECKILYRDDQTVMNGEDFRNKVGGTVCEKCRTIVCDCPRDQRKAKEGETVRVDVIGDFEEFKRIVPNLAVLARSKPDDKYTLVVGLQAMGHVVAVTGDGTNDAPALKRADIGFAMGIAGTEMSKEAADIMLMDDNFNSIVKAVMWGRNIYDNIRRFLTFQLTVNVVAVSCAIIGAVTISQSPLTPVQMLWVNLIMDTFASLALATEPPTEAHLKRKPHNRNEYIVSKIMWKHIFGQAVVQLAIILTMMYAGEWFLPEFGSGKRIQYNSDASDCVQAGRNYDINGDDAYIDDFKEPSIGPSRQFTYIFNTFVLMQLVNEFNARKIHDELNCFSGLCTSPMFLGIWIFTLFAQVILVEVGGIALSCHLDGLTWEQWLICIAFAGVGLPWRLVLLLIPNKGCLEFGNKERDIATEGMGLLEIRKSSNSLHHKMSMK
jgi:Ca2+ transporting ATPase